MASKMCEAWAKIFPDFLHPDGDGKQVQHDPAKGSWLPCSVFCKTTSNTWYSPRRELENYHLSSYFPDGTLCYPGEGSEGNYYCQDRLCLLRAWTPLSPSPGTSWERKENTLMRMN